MKLEDLLNVIYDDSLTEIVIEKRNNWIYRGTLEKLTDTSFVGTNHNVEGIIVDTNRLIIVLGEDEQQGMKEHIKRVNYLAKYLYDLTRGKDTCCLDDVSTWQMVIDAFLEELDDMTNELGTTED